MSMLDKLASWLDRREIEKLRKKLEQMERDKIRDIPHIRYLEHRDKMVSEMANIICRQAFKIAELKGDYSNTRHKIQYVEIVK